MKRGTSIDGTSMRLSSLRTRLACALVLASQCCLSGEPLPTGAVLAFVDATPVNVSPRGADLVSDLYIRNTGTQFQPVTLCRLGRHGTAPCEDDLEVIEPKSPLPAGSVTRVRVRWPRLDGPDDGYLALLGAQRNVIGVKPFHLVSPPFSWVIWVPLVVGMVLALAMLVECCFRLRAENISLSESMGLPTSWDFSRSWGSNVTVVSGFLSIALAASAVAETRFISKQGYAVLSIFILAVVGSAPFVFNVFRKPICPKPVADEAGPQYEGKVVYFVVASGLTVAAVVAQIVTFVLLLFDLDSQRGTPFLMFFAFCVFLLGVGVLVYSRETIFWTICEQKAETAVVGDEPTRDLAASDSVDARVPVRKRHSRWVPL